MSGTEEWEEGSLPSAILHAQTFSSSPSTSAAAACLQSKEYISLSPSSSSLSRKLRTRKASQAEEEAFNFSSLCLFLLRWGNGKSEKKRTSKHILERREGVESCVNHAVVFALPPGL